MVLLTVQITKKTYILMTISEDIRMPCIYTYTYDTGQNQRSINRDKTKEHYCI